MMTYICDVELKTVAGGGHSSSSTKITTKGYAKGKQYEEGDVQVVQNGVASTGGSVSISGEIKQPRNIIPLV